MVLLCLKITFVLNNSSLIIKADKPTTFGPILPTCTCIPALKEKQRKCAGLSPFVSLSIFLFVCLFEIFSHLFYYISVYAV